MRVIEDTKKLVTKNRHYVIIISTSMMFYLFLREWLFKKNKNIFSPCLVKKQQATALFYYKNVNSDVHIISSLIRLWNEPRLLKKESKKNYFFQQVYFEVYFYMGRYNDLWNNIYPNRYKKSEQLVLIDRKKDTFGGFLNSFSRRTLREKDTWDYGAYQHLMRKKIKKPKVVKPNILKTHISTKLVSIIEQLKNNEKVQVTALKSLNRIEDYFGHEFCIKFTQMLVDKTWMYYLEGKSLCRQDIFDTKIKEIFFREAIVLIKNCFNDLECNIDTSNQINILLQQINEYIGSKRVAIHATRYTPADPEILLLIECLGYFIYTNGKQEFGDIARPYTLAKYYCTHYTNLRFDVDKGSIERVEDILEFVYVCEREKHKTMESQ